MEEIGGKKTLLPERLESKTCTTSFIDRYINLFYLNWLGKRLVRRTITMKNSTFHSFGDQASCRLGVSVFFTTVMAIISVAAFTGNILVIVAVCKTPDLRTSTNYYYVNMAVSDFFLVSSPGFVPHRWDRNKQWKSVARFSGNHWLQSGSILQNAISYGIHSKLGFDWCQKIRRYYCLSFESAADHDKTKGNFTVCNMVDISGLLYPHVLLF